MIKDIFNNVKIGVVSFFSYVNNTVKNDERFIKQLNKIKTQRLKRLKANNEI